MCKKMSNVLNKLNSHSCHQSAQVDVFGFSNLVSKPVLPVWDNIAGFSHLWLSLCLKMDAVITKPWFVFLRSEGRPEYWRCCGVLCRRRQSLPCQLIWICTFDRRSHCLSCAPEGTSSVPGGLESPHPEPRMMLKMMNMMQEILFFCLFSA